MYLKEGHRLYNDKYQLLNVLGEGGFSLTYRGAWKTEVQGSLGAIPTLVPVCIKEYFFKDYCLRNPKTGFIETNSETGKEIFGKNKEKIIKEAQILSEIHHPNVVNVLEVFKQNNTVYIVMEFISGLSLKQLVEQKGVFSEDKLKKIVYKIGQALDYIHGKNILHLDIKPSNILMDRNQNPKLIDFGISKRYDLTDDQQTSTTLQAASKGYASIEQYDSEAMQVFSPRPDIYSLGATMYFLLTGQVPTESILRSTKGLTNPRELNPNISEKTEEVILKSMALNANDRYENIMDMLFDLGYDPEKDKIDVDSLDGTLAEKTELIKKIKEQPYDADAEDATVIHPDNVENIEKKKDRFWFYLIGLGIILLIPLFYIFRNNNPEEDTLLVKTDTDSYIFDNYYQAGVSHYQKRNYSQAQEEFRKALEIKETPEILYYINSIDSINNVLVRSDDSNSNPTDTKTEANQIQEPVELDPKEEKYSELYAEANIAYGQNDLHKALNLFNEALTYKQTTDLKRRISALEQQIEKNEIENRLNLYDLYPKFGNFVVARKKTDGLFGAIDDKGNEVIPFIYIASMPHNEDRLFQRQTDQLYDLYSPSGDLLKAGTDGFD